MEIIGNSPSATSDRMTGEEMMKWKWQGIEWLPFSIGRSGLLSQHVYIGMSSPIISSKRVSVNISVLFLSRWYTLALKDFRKVIYVGFMLTVVISIFRVFLSSFLIFIRHLITDRVNSCARFFFCFSLKVLIGLAVVNLDGILENSISLLVFELGL